MERLPGVRWLQVGLKEDRLKEDTGGAESAGATSGLRTSSALAATDAVREIFAAALEATRVAATMERQVRVEDGVLRVDGLAPGLGSGLGYDLSRDERLIVVAIGKAAVPMVEALLRVLGPWGARAEGIAVGVASGAVLPESMRFFAGGHPSPNAASLEAGTAILELLRGAAGRDLVVFLISGGGSAMVEQMLCPGLEGQELGLAEVIQMHRALVESGAPIAAINAVRKHVSAVKGGRLAEAAAGAEQLTLLVSDVAAGQLDALASGPTVADGSTVEDARRVVREFGLAERLPKQVVAWLQSEQVAETPKPGDAVFARSAYRVLLDSRSLEAAAAERARAMGLEVTLDSACDDWSSEAAAEYLLERLGVLKKARPEAKICVIAAGEVTVRVTGEGAGRGGRNQHFALQCAERMVGKNWVVLSAGSDGVDGNSPAAGAVVDGSTVARAAELGYPVADALAGFDAYGLLERLGDVVVTGPTGNNLRDLRILLAF